MVGVAVAGGAVVGGEAVVGGSEVGGTVVDAVDAVGEGATDVGAAAGAVDTVAVLDVLDVLDVGARNGDGRHDRGVRLRCRARALPAGPGGQRHQHQHTGDRHAGTAPAPDATPRHASTDRGRTTCSDHRSSSNQSWCSRSSTTPASRSPPARVRWMPSLWRTKVGPPRSR